MSSLSNLQSLTRQQYRFDPNGRVFGDSELELYINQSYKTVQVELGLLLESKETITTVSGTQEYTLPTNLYHISSVQFGSETLPQINYEDNDTTLSKPINYYIRETATGLSLGLSGIPDGAYSIEVYYKWYRADIDSTTDASTPTQYDLLIALYSAYIAEYTLRGNSQNAVAKMQAYNQEKARLAKGRYKTNITFWYKR